MCQCEWEGSVSGERAWDAAWAQAHCVCKTTSQLFCFASTGAGPALRAEGGKRSLDLPPLSPQLAFFLLLVNASAVDNKVSLLMVTVLSRVCIWFKPLALATLAVAFRCYDSSETQNRGLTLMISCNQFTVPRDKGALPLAGNTTENWLAP
eukprot:619385-Rhodomonas_salina.2